MSRNAPVDPAAEWRAELVKRYRTVQGLDESVPAGRRPDRYVPPDTSGDLAQRLSRLTVPAPRLALLGRPVERFFATKLGLLLPAAITALMTARAAPPGSRCPPVPGVEGELQ
ncbi:hypothetical protein [Microbispora bryophytorum]|uniref:Uncharacterized protein n=1 Tax=Microbispora bryophytorum TaxID=1460882 RepID=A0A8H9L9G1_9ACTN|nr:hypothetical protein [Microbispora bryophytorum]MBD3140202.1 hypothetical protein [Microbispora bryophytorum]TQS02311.1 hypothetical protein FLX07_28990 [Microbispora bryophytorum]GGO06738.1 hypothetical protein GCM10011574_19610 [Microbispora bryophytorum]